MNIEIPVSKQILTAVAAIDRFRGRWSARPGASESGLARVAAATRIQSTAASCRLAGIRVSDVEVSGLVHGQTIPLTDAADILGYHAALGHALPSSVELLDTDHLRTLNAVMLGKEAPSCWRQGSLHREAFDADGQATGRVFSTLPPRYVHAKTEELLTWLEFELRSGESHAVLVISVFLLYLLAISPFDGGNGRLNRILGGHLLRRAGYDYIDFGSIEAEIETQREEYYLAFDRAQTRIWTAEVNIEGWVGFYLEILSRHCERVALKMERERGTTDYPPLQRAILQTVQEHGTVDAALLLRATGANRNTLKDNLRKLVLRGALQKSGERRGTRYRIG